MVKRRRCGSVPHDRVVALSGILRWRPRRLRRAKNEVEDERKVKWLWCGHGKGKETGEPTRCSPRTIPLLPVDFLPPFVQVATPPGCQFLYANPLKGSPGFDRRGGTACPHGDCPIGLPPLLPRCWAMDAEGLRRGHSGVRLPPPILRQSQAVGGVWELGRPAWGPLVLAEGRECRVLRRAGASRPDSPRAVACRRRFPAHVLAGERDFPGPHAGIVSTFGSSFHLYASISRWNWKFLLRNSSSHLCAACITQRFQWGRPAQASS